MGIGSSLKKAMKDIGKGFLSPWNLLLGPIGIGISINDEKRKKLSLEAKKNEYAANQIEEGQKQEVERQFAQELEKERRANAPSNVIFAGVLGSKGKVGLGGQKNLLGL